MKLNAVVFDEQNVPSSINNSYNYNETESFSLSSSKQQSTETLSPASLGTSMSPGAGPLWWSDAPGQPRGAPPPLRLTFRTPRQPWEGVLVGRTLYVALPPCMLPEGSREAFVALLEAAEEQLHCQHVVVVFNGDRQDRPVLVRTFMFLGFAVLAPTSPLVPAALANGNNVCMLYNIE
ncbi:LOW QUALITY PROTEIN: ornithine decarboxylase antizyme 1 [Onthophagus taurus]|uniref:LOW QUALITY PROTEIN: ornithine decarboxylase antizyme 1 n=1 Tax=Onthophagus taurus TaxID=166361 RepID=UPI0039BE13D4